MDLQIGGETQMDFLQCLAADLSCYIMRFLDDPADVVRASCVSRVWHQFVIANGLAKELCVKVFPQLLGISIVYLSSDSTNSSEVEPKHSMDSEILGREHKAYASLLQALSKSKLGPKDCIANAVSASSTDNYPDESVINTLNPRDRFVRRASYWSSTGQSKPEVPETLIYKLRAGIWVISEIDIQPFEAFFQSGRPIYSASSVRFRMGYPKSPREIAHDLKHLPLETPADDKFEWTYTSPEFPMMQESRLQPFKLPEPVLCIGGYLQIELLGRVQRQEMDGLFYVCVCYVRVLGRTIFPAFDVDILEPSGKVLLKYYPENLRSVLECSSSEGVPHLRHLEEQMLWERIGLLEDLLRGIQHRPNQPDVWDEEDLLRVRGIHGPNHPDVWDEEDDDAGAGVI